jgi:capsular exopolysaccharide synthesis family protein
MKPVTKQLNTKEESLFVKMLTKYLTYWPLFLVFFILITAAAYTYLHYAPPKYEATASLIIKDEKKGSDDSKLVESLNIINSKKIIENEIEVLQSGPIIANVVKQLHLYAPIYRKNKIVSVSVYQEAAVSVMCENADNVTRDIAKQKIYFTYDSAQASVLLNNKYTVPVNKWENTPYGTLMFIPNKKFVADPVENEFYFSIIGTESAVKKIQDNLKVTATNKLSSVIDLKYKDGTPQLAADVLNGIIAEYNNVNIEEKKELAKNTLGFIEERLNAVGTELSSIENNIQKYKANSGAVDISTQGQLFLQNVSTNDQKLSDVNMQLMVIEQIEKQVSSGDDVISVLPSALGVSDPTLSQLVTTLNASELEREKLKKTVAENNPILVAVTDQISKNKRDILEHIQTERSSLEASKTTLTATNGSYNSVLHTIPVKERALLEISRDQNIKNGIYAFLLQKREESELSYAATISDSRIVNYAQASDIPVSPNRLIVLGIAFILFLGVPITFINAREAFNPAILYRQEIESLTSIPIIGEIAHNKSSKPLVIEEGKRSFIAEEFRKIRVALLFMGIDATHKKILLTSAISGEGKSFVAANLAISFSLTGKKVALVDMDLHNSSLCRIFDKEQQIGVSDYLSGDINATDIIYPVPVYDNLSFVSSGSLRDKPSELFENGRVQELINYLGTNFDMVIIDSEPIELVPDAHLLSGCCDVTLYVIRHMYSPKVLLKRFERNNEISPLLNPAIIFNGVKNRGYIKDNYGYSYGYGYVYGEKELSKRAKRKEKQHYA